MNTPSSEKFEQLIQSMSAKLHRLAQRLCGNKADAEDLIQDTLLRAYRHFDKCRDLMAFESWVLTIARNTFIQKVSRRKKHAMVSLNQIGMQEQIEMVVDDNALSPYDQLLRSSMSPAIANALAKLPEQSRRMILMVVVEQATYSEIAEVYRIPVGTVKSRISRICAKLKTTYESNMRRDENLLQMA